jgi:hypothetical protein
VRGAGRDRTQTKRFDLVQLLGDPWIDRFALAHGRLGWSLVQHARTAITRRIRWSGQAHPQIVGGLHVAMHARAQVFARGHRRARELWKFAFGVAICVAVTVAAAQRELGDPVRSIVVASRDRCVAGGQLHLPNPEAITPR